MRRKDKERDAAFAWQVLRDSAYSVLAMTDEEGNLRKDLTNDGLHLLPEAYEIWIEILRPYINE